MGVMYRTKLNPSKAPTISAAAATWGVCAADEVAIFIGTTPTKRLKGVTIINRLRKQARDLVKRPGAAPGVAATGTITLTVAIATNSVSIGPDGGPAITLTFVDADPTALQVLKGATDAASAVNLAAKINGNVTISALVKAAVDGAVPEKINLTSRARNVGANLITLAKVGAPIAISGATLASGATKVKGCRLVPGVLKPTVSALASATAVTETNIAVVYGDSIHEAVTRSARFLNAVEHLLKHYQQNVSRVS